MSPDQLERAIHDLFEGQLEGEVLTELNAELRSNPAAREAYRDHQLLHHCLRYRSRGADLTKMIPMEEVIRRRQRRAMQRALMASAAVIAIGMLTLMFIIGRPNTPTLSFKLTPGADVSISHDLSGHELPGDREMEPGSSMQLKHGCVELEFKSGINAVIQGPAKLTLEREDLLKLDQGVAWFNVPGKAVGFQVITPDLVLTDLGTEFGILSRPEAEDEVHVFQGKVQLLNRGARKAQETLTTKQARIAKSSGEWDQAKLDPNIFLTELPAVTSPPVQLIGSSTFTSSPNNEMRRGPYAFEAKDAFSGFSTKGANKLVVTLSHENGNIDEVTYEGLRMTQAVVSRSHNISTAIYYLDSPPAGGNLEIRTTGACNGVGGSILALANAQRGKPAIAMEQGGCSASLTTQSSNCMVIASLGTNQLTDGHQAKTQEPLTLLFGGPCGSSNGASAYTMLAKPRRLDISFKTTGDRPAIAAIAIHPSP